MKPPQCMDYNCGERGIFRIKDNVMSSNDGWAYFCDNHIGDHLTRCVEPFDETFHRVKTVRLEFVD